MSRLVAAATIGSRAFDAVGEPVEIVPEVGGRPVAPAGARVVMAFPDVLGRMVPPVGGWEVVAVVDRMVRSTVEVGPGHRRIDVGEDLGEPGALVAALGDVRKRITTAGGVREVVEAPYAIPLIAPGAVDGLPGWCALERPSVPGLADLAVVVPVDTPSWRGRRHPVPAIAVR